MKYKLFLPYFLLFIYDSCLAGSSGKFVILVCTYMRDEYQQHRVGLGPLHELVDLQHKYDGSLNFNWTLQLIQALKKQLYHSFRKEVVSA